MAHGKLIGLAGGFLLSLLILTSWIAAQDIQIPAEFLFGRWAQGHHVTGDWRFQDAYEPQHRFSYAYTGGHFRAIVDSLSEYALWDNDDYINRNAPVTLYWRPKGNLQLGVERISYGSQHGEFLSRDQLPGITVFDDETLSLKPQVYYASNQSLQASSRHAAFWYLREEFLSPGRFLVRSSASIELRESWTNDQQMYGEGRLSVMSRQGNRSVLGLNAQFSLGLLESLNLKGVVRATAARADDVIIEASSLVDPSQLMRGERESRNDDLYYALQLVGEPLPSVYASVGLAYTQEFVRWLTDLEVHDEDEGLSHEVDTNWGPWGATAAEGSFGLTYLSLGDFDSRILLDDYQDFYGHLLFDRQTLLQIRGTYTDLSWYRESARIEIEARRGFGNHADVGLRGHYQYSHYRRSDVALRGIASSLELRFRTFEYLPGRGPGWDRDSRYDIAFGTLPTFGQWLVSLSVDAFSGAAYDRGRGGFLDLDDAEVGIDFDGYRINHILGLGRRIAVTSTAALHMVGASVDRLHLDQHDYAIGLMFRPLEMVQFAAAVSDITDRLKEYAWGPQAPKWSVRLDVLL